MGDYNHEQWDRDLGDFAFEDVFPTLDQRTAAKPQRPKDGTVAGVDETSNEPRGDRARTTVSTVMTGKSGATSDLRKTILNLENAKLQLGIRQLDALSLKVERIVQHLGELQPFLAEIRAMMKEVMTRDDSGYEVKSPKPQLAMHGIDHGIPDASRTTSQ
ncbi:MAG: hypothetical protein Q9209_003743 [Squamulea sp. 1 TL-2023]